MSGGIGTVLTLAAVGAATGAGLGVVFALTLGWYPVSVGIALGVAQGGGYGAALGVAVHGLRLWHQRDFGRPTGWGLALAGTYLLTVTAVLVLLIGTMLVLRNARNTTLQRGKAATDDVAAVLRTRPELAGIDVGYDRRGLMIYGAADPANKPALLDALRAADPPIGYVVEVDWTPAARHRH